jgi:hypothetical protein
MTRRDMKLGETLMSKICDIRVQEWHISWTQSLATLFSHNLRNLFT